MRREKEGSRSSRSKVVSVLLHWCTTMHVAPEVNVRWFLGRAPDAKNDSLVFDKVFYQSSLYACLALFKRRSREARRYIVRNGTRLIMFLFI